ncbi:DUF4381 domain-containing protein [Shewanella youngdeokensis]|uniref:DUF4381 domain-containing protein n=1 Tax=Shewanella youngdeokensis TaxID=2999068 RepID=A0ABZ0JWV8_9GAMM|nr:DUF4381 domain-containing protein [Shewanella sp. DAU334]
MAEQNPAANPALASLQDIQLPIEIGNWPFAYGYWLVLLIVCIAFTAAVIGFRKRRQRCAAKRAALVELAALDGSDPLYISHVSEILKRAAMSYCDRNSVAGLSGTQWHDWLTAQVDTAPVELCKLLNMAYQPQALTPTQAALLQKSAAQWLKKALPLKGNNSANATAHPMEAKPC